MTHEQSKSRLADGQGVQCNSNSGRSTLRRNDSRRERDIGDLLGSDCTRLSARRPCACGFAQGRAVIRHALGHPQLSSPVASDVAGSFILPGPRALSQRSKSIGDEFGGSDYCVAPVH